MWSRDLELLHDGPIEMARLRRLVDIDRAVIVTVTAHLITP